MRSYLLCLAACGLLPILAHNTLAAWLDVPLPDQINLADLIVEGSVVDIMDAGFNDGIRPYDAAIVDVSVVLKNTTDMTDILEVRIAQPSLTLIGGSADVAFSTANDIRYRVGQQGTWLLDFDPRQQIFWATLPSQFQVDDISSLVAANTSIQGDGQPASASVPEPSTGLVSCVGLLVFFLAGRKRRAGQAPESTDLGLGMKEPYKK